MTIEQIVFIIVIGVIVLAMRTRGRGRRSWTQIACPDCNGAGGDIKTARIRGRTRKIRRPCKACGGSPWAAR